MSFVGSLTPIGRHRKTRSGIPVDETPILEGWLARESTVVDRLLNRRYAKIYSSTFATYRRDTDDSPSKAWPITKSVSVGPIEGPKEFHVRHAKTSTLWAVAAGAYDVKNLWAFTVNWSALVGGPDKLTLAFDTKESADEWHTAFEEAIEKAALRPAGVHLRSMSAASEASAATLEAIAKLSAGPSGTLAGAGSRGGSGALPDGIVPVGAAGVGGLRTSTQQPPPTSAVSAGGKSSGVTAGSGSSSRKSRSWASVLHINGISVYVEDRDEDGEGGAVMVSAVVRTPPVDVFKSLVQVRRNEGLGIFAGARTIDVIDANTQVVVQQWNASGVAGSLCAPREMVLLRTWRKDEDGTYIVLYQSTTHPAARVQRGWRWSTPVRVQVQAAGFTIAPLMPDYAVGGVSQESLVTLVLKADLGGWLSDSTMGGRLAAPFTGHAVRSMLEPVVASLVVLRDRVEQNRFVVRPLSMQTSEDVEDEAIGGGKRGTSGRSSMQRTTTMLISRTPLALEQRKAAQRPADRLVLDATPPAKRAAAAAAAIESAAPPTGAAAGETTPAAPADATPAAEDAWAIAGTCPKQYWLSPGNCNFKVRGGAYLTDRKKIAAAPPMFELVAVDLLELEEPMDHICAHLPSVRHSPAPFLFCVQMMVPSTPPKSLVCTWAAPFPVMGVPPEDLIAHFEREQGPCPDHVASFFRSFADFLEGDGEDADRRRNARFKLIPNIPKGSWVIRQSVGTTPVLLGQKLTTKYFRGANYFEVDVDIGASSVAASITNLVCGATKSLAVDLGVLVEGQCDAHLPEQLVGTVRLDALDLASACYFDESTGRLFKPDK